MMSLIDYAQDVGTEVNKVKKLCDKIGSKYENEDSLLSEDDIILLDNEMQDEEDYIKDSDNSEYIEEIEDIEKAEALAESVNIDIDPSENFQKLKNRAVKKQEAKTNFLKERKKIYKHRDKLQSNEVKVEDDVILYKEG